MSDLRPDLDEAIAFNHLHRPDGPWVLTAIPAAKGPTKTRTFRPETEAEARAWIQRLNLDRHHIYFMFNLPKNDLDSKASKADVQDMVGGHVDIDPKKGEDPASARSAANVRLEGYRRPPTFAIDSGGGVQAGWLFDAPLYLGAYRQEHGGAAYSSSLLMNRFRGMLLCELELSAPGMLKYLDQPRQSLARCHTIATNIARQVDNDLSSLPQSKEPTQ